MTSLPTHLPPFRFYVRIFLLPALLLILLQSGCARKTITQPGPEAQLSPAVQKWHQMMQQNRYASERQKLVVTNDFFNRLKYVDDAILWGKKDYWATPTEMLDKGAGDCEDFAIAKYLTLRQINVAEEKMRITYVIAVQRNNTPHMVLNYYSTPTAVPLVLDSLQPAILSASQRQDLLPVYSFNAHDLWVAKKSHSQKVHSAEGLSRWQDLLKKFQAEAVAAPLPE